MKRIHFMECLCTMTLSNLLKHWLSRVLGTGWQCTTVFSEKNIELNKCEKVDFLHIRRFFIAEMRKTSG